MFYIEQPSEKSAFILFFIHHWSLEAIEYIKELPKYSQFVFARIGNYCKDFKAPDNSTSSVITLCTYGVEIDENLIPLCQLSTTENGAALLKRFFRELLRCKLPIPKLLKTDFDFNHYGAANAIFNINISIEEYLMMCFSYLIKQNTLLPLCIITVNIRLLLVRISESKCISEISADSVKNFYIYCIALLSFQDNLEDFENIMQQILTFIYSEYKNSFTHDIFEFLKSKIKFYKIDSVYNKGQLVDIKKEFVNYNYQLSDIVDYRKCNDIVHFVKKIADQAYTDATINITNKEDRNIYYNKQFRELLVQVAVQFVLWTKVMAKAIDCSTSNNYCNIICNYQKDI